METPNTISVCPVGSLSADLYSGNNFRKPADSQTLTACRPTMPVIKVQPFISGDGAERSWIRKLLAHSVELFICALIIVVVCLAFVFGFGGPGSCVGKFQCGFSSQCIISSAQCDGKVDCDNGEDELGCVRLSGRSSVLQVQKEGVWKTVCSEDWNNWLGASACKQLGFNSYVESLFIPLTSIEQNLQYDLVSISLSSNLTIKLQNTATFSKPQCTSNKVTSLKCLKCGVRPKYAPRVKHSVQIVGGNLSRPGQFPWQVSLHFNKVHRCGGSIVSAFWIVTAAHCLFGFINHSMWTVHVGKTMQQADGPQSLAVEKTIFHILYDPNGMDYDVALMKLSKPLVFNGFVEPICLPNYGEKFEQGTECWISGWGASQSKVPGLFRWERNVSTLGHGAHPLHKDLQSARDSPGPHLTMDGLCRIPEGRN
ncbi:transmembrane protease serine 3-like isoform X2 [Nerophis lumbriciformis]|uniref:transmembrane protease serine 3-like isoform X2 n=1 Tax=Nerophis lumbriciformis TaxID=546530 RepID=UPI002ADF172C|nr:transmembrane protease serine 3-like isoform X2 [Nerophis lumbriciformis]